MTTNEKYYFVRYQWRHHSDDYGVWLHSNMVIKEHPILWLKDCHNSLYNQEYLINFYEEISEEIYNEIYDFIG